LEIGNIDVRNQIKGDTMKGDALASGARSATFAVAPNIKFSEGEMRDDLLKIPQEEFITKYMVTAHEYRRLYNGRNDPERVSSFAAEMQQRAEMHNRDIAADAKQEQSLRRDCPVEPFVIPVGQRGRVIVSRDSPSVKPSSIVLPNSLRKERPMLPTTGHIIKATIRDDQDFDLGPEYVGKRVLFSPMSGTAICFKNYPTWIQLDLSEILALVNIEDIQLVEEELESMV
jgi:hypothetical protein